MNSNHSALNPAFGENWRLPDPGSRVTVVETSGFSAAHTFAMAAWNMEILWEQGLHTKPTGACRGTDALPFPRRGSEELQLEEDEMDEEGEEE